MRRVCGGAATTSTTSADSGHGVVLRSEGSARSGASALWKQQLATRCYRYSSGPMSAVRASRKHKSHRGYPSSIGRCALSEMFCSSASSDEGSSSRDSECKRKDWEELRTTRSDLQKHANDSKPIARRTCSTDHEWRLLHRNISFNDAKRDGLPCTGLLMLPAT